MVQTFVGTSGYCYDHWTENVFYPAGLPQREYLEFYARHFDSVELNVSFYRLPKKETFVNWAKRTPRGFSFVVKGSRYITHIKRLKGIEESLRFFFAQISGLGNKLSAVLWQLPPGFKKDLSRLEGFLRNTRKIKRKLRLIFEFRHPSWFAEDTYHLLRKRNICLCIAHSPHWPVAREVTADFVYLRFHGGQHLYGSNYTEEELREWADFARQILAGRKDLYAFFNNDACGYAVRNALRFRELLGGK
jgi:uncharacterized protein YecE (DUF72 family)